MVIGACTIDLAVGRVNSPLEMLEHLYLLLSLI